MRLNSVENVEYLYTQVVWNFITNGLIILMRQIRKSHWNEYWSTDPLLETPIFPKIMTRRRFKQIMTFLHFNNNSEAPLPADRISKVKPHLLFSTKISIDLYTQRRAIT